ncbi:MAG: hypothetical protein A2020_08395 [Lentisphaerae bacterium GWF2_45_14]|nr:MAG: hypothetical protein A2020_08395 [Lentisphaerae bacterium GWF2_45_14]
MESDTIEKIFNYLKKEFEFDEQDVNEMLDEFLSNTHSLLERSSESLKNGTWNELKRTAHSIKGASANLGADMISLLGKELENASFSSDKEKAEAIITEISKALENLKNQHS